MLVRQMHSGLLLSVGHLIDKIRFSPLPINTPFSEEQINIYQLKLARYLRGVGHPAHPSILENLITPTMRAEVVHDHLYRARQFLKCATGSNMVPPSKDWEITVTICIFLSESSVRFLSC